jgi:type I restriction enzyme S subunit
MKPIILIKFLEAYLNIADITQYINGTTRGKLNQGDMNKILIPIPPLSIQKQIVEILERAESLKNKREQSNEETNQLIQSIFYSMFGNPIKNERGWTIKKIFEVSEVVSGSTPDTTNADYWGGTIKWITPAELIDGDNYYYSDTKRKITESGSKSIGGRLFPKDTVMLTTRAPIGKVAIAGDKMSSNQGFKNLLCDKKQLNPIYMYVLLLSKKKYLNDLGTGATFKEISKKTVENIEIAVPSLDLQNKFASIVEMIESIREHQKESTKEVNLLFDALMQKAFAGELV